MRETYMVLQELTEENHVVTEVSEVFRGGHAET